MYTRITARGVPIRFSDEKVSETISGLLKNNPLVVFVDNLPQLKGWEGKKYLPGEPENWECPYCGTAHAVPAEEDILVGGCGTGAFRGCCEICGVESADYGGDPRDS